MGQTVFLCGTWGSLLSSCGIGGIQFLMVVGLRPQLFCWLLAKGHSVLRDHPRVPALWPLHNMAAVFLKASRKISSPVCDNSLTRCNLTTGLTQSPLLDSVGFEANHRVHTHSRAGNSFAAVTHWRSPQNAACHRVVSSSTVPSLELFSRNPAYAFVNGPSIKFFSNYPCRSRAFHLFLPGPL